MRKDVMIMTLQQAVQMIQMVPEDKRPDLIRYAQFLNEPSSRRVTVTRKKNIRKCGRLKGKIWMADDFNDTPDEFREYL